MLSSKGSHVLPLIAEYHEPQQRLRPLEVGLRRSWIEELFVPRRVVASGIREIPVRLPLHRRVEVGSRGATIMGVTRFIGLDRIDVDLARRAELSPGTLVVLAVEGGVADLWWRFHGRIIHTRAGRRLSIALDRTLGCQARWGSGAATTEPDPHRGRGAGRRRGTMSG